MYLNSLASSNPFYNARNPVLTLFSAKILSKVVEYMLYKKLHANELVEEFFIEPEIALDMMLAADYLDL